MIGLKIPVFEKGSILTQEMLESLKTFAVEFGQMTYEGYGNGILSGCNITITKDVLTIHKGLVVFGGQLYFISQEIRLHYDATNQWKAVKLYFGEVSQEQSFLEGELHAELTDNIQKETMAVELCRFRLQPGAILRTSHRGLADYETEFDTISQIEAEWAAYEESSIAPAILHQFAKEAKAFTLTNPHDVSMIYQIETMGAQTIKRSALEYYIASRLEREQKKLSNREIFEGLLQILKTIKQGKTESRMPRRSTRMIID